eukprot:6204879-Pleurochrysis_carterae.AAC.2
MSHGRQHLVVRALPFRAQRREQAKGKQATCETNNFEKQQCSMGQEDAHVCSIVCFHHTPGKSNCILQSARDGRLVLQQKHGMFGVVGASKYCYVCQLAAVLCASASPASLWRRLSAAILELAIRPQSMLPANLVLCVFAQISMIAVAQAVSATRKQNSSLCWPSRCGMQAFATILTWNV